MPGCMGYLQRLVRKKTFTETDIQTSPLKRCLTLIDLIGLGTSSTLGAGVYMLSGQVARESAGPAVVLSFAVGGLAAALAGFCYAEFSARVPRAGSAYVYSYVTVGELMAFVIGWNMLLEYAISMSTLSRALSSYVDFLTNHTMQNFFRAHTPINVHGLAAYPDFFACGLVLLATALVAWGAKESTRINNLFTVVNLGVILFILVGGSMNADLHNWNLSAEEVPATGAGSGGFAPFGFSGIMTGAGTCFFAFIGFDFLASMGEEAKNPRRVIPISIAVTLLVNLVCLCSVAAVVNLMLPYFRQDLSAPIVKAFHEAGWPWATYIVTVGAVFGMVTSMTASAFPMSRAVYAMASDGLLFTALAYVSPVSRTPIFATFVSGLFAAVMVLLFDVTQLIHMLSIGTLLAFALVAVCVLILRYEPDNESTPETDSGAVETTPGCCQNSSCCLLQLWRPCSRTPTPRTSFVTKVSTACIGVLSAALSGFVNVNYERLTAGTAWCVAVTLLLASGVLLALACIACQPQSSKTLMFKVPLVPVLPAMSCLVNVYLMFKLPATTWIIFGVWMTVGFCIYFFYGFRHSVLHRQSGEREPLSVSFASHNHYTIAHRTASAKEETKGDTN